MFVISRNGLLVTIINNFLGEIFTCIYVFRDLRQCLKGLRWKRKFKINFKIQILISNCLIINHKTAFTHAGTIAAVRNCSWVAAATNDEIWPDLVVLPPPGRFRSIDLQRFTKHSWCCVDSLHKVGILKSTCKQSSPSEATRTFRPYAVL